MKYWHGESQTWPQIGVKEFHRHKSTSGYKKNLTLNFNPYHQPYKLDASGSQKNSLSGRWLSLTPYYYYFLSNEQSIDFHCDAGHKHREHTS